jgi:hypothetical protein
VLLVFGSSHCVGKQLNGPHIGKRSPWSVKVKCVGRQEFIVGGFIHPQRSRVGLRALLIGYYSDGGHRLICAGKVGTGYTHEVLRDLRACRPLMRGTGRTDPSSTGSSHGSWPRLPLASGGPQGVREDVGEKTGLHVFTPWNKHADYHEARAWALGMAQRMVEALPDRATIERSKARRGKRVYIDVMQNAKGHHAVPPCVLRAIPGAPVSTPVHWQELTPHLDPGAYNLKTIFPRLARLARDPMAGLLRLFRHDRPVFLQAIEGVPSRVEG